MSRIGEVIGLYLKVNNISGRGFARALDIDHVTISRILNGQTPTTEDLLKILNWLLLDEEQPQ